MSAAVGKLNEAVQCAPHRRRTTCHICSQGRLECGSLLEGVREALLGRAQVATQVAHGGGLPRPARLLTLSILHANNTATGRVQQGCKYAFIPVIVVAHSHMFRAFALSW